MEKERICPYCDSRNIQIVQQIGLAPCNIWNDIICLDCEARWEKDSKKDKLSKKLHKERKGVIIDRVEIYDEFHCAEKINELVGGYNQQQKQIQKIIDSLAH